MHRSLRLSHPTEERKPADALARIEELLKEMAEAEDWPVTLTMQANLVLEELVLNTFTHGHTGGLTAIELDLDSNDGGLTISLTDDGAPFDPLADAPEPDLTLPLSERPIGGLGLHLVRTIGQDLEYRRDNDRNHLKLVIPSES
ncbi:ATP-binding protein [Candidatus Poriferisocius sp.]|uniref:ATP-binding protein n=1 Tax=Candidatus Poriferisocius sp. TaxID=3101276 RepID=UPI003B5A975F